MVYSCPTYNCITVLYLRVLIQFADFCRADLEEKLAYEAATLSNNSSTATEDLTEMRKRNISIYGALVGGTFLLAFASSDVFLSIAISASQNLHNKMFKKLLGATTYFFDTNPAGGCWLIHCPFPLRDTRAANHGSCLLCLEDVARVMNTTSPIPCAQVLQRDGLLTM